MANILVNDEAKKEKQIDIETEEFIYFKKFLAPRDCLESDKAYRNRINHCIAVFKKLNRTEKTFVEAARQDGLFYRGEPFWLFRIIYDEFIHMQPMNPEQKRMAARESFKKLLKAAKQPAKTRTEIQQEAIEQHVKEGRITEEDKHILDERTRIYYEMTAGDR